MSSLKIGDCKSVDIIKIMCKSCGNIIQFEVDEFSNVYQFKVSQPCDVCSKKIQKILDSDEILLDKECRPVL
jgi:hypothetical protein